jgi:anti-anti-sigma factor
MNKSIFNVDIQVVKDKGLMSDADIIRGGNMFITSEKKGDTVFIRIIGALDTSTAEILRSKLDEIAAPKPSHVVLDLSHVPTIGSVGIGIILMFFKTIQGYNSLFEIKGIHENLYPFFKATKLDKLFSIAQ